MRGGMMHGQPHRNHVCPRQFPVRSSGVDTFVALPGRTANCYRPEGGDWAAGRPFLGREAQFSSGADQVVGPASAGTGGKRVAATIKEMGRLS
jgi:hypothetical protein